jgi:glycyl-tRNA synthetase beta subunit
LSSFLSLHQLKHSLASATVELGKNIVQQNKRLLAPRLTDALCLYKPQGKRSSSTLST